MRPEAPEARARDTVDRLPWRPLLGLALATPPLTWWSVGDLSSGDHHDFGPYHLSLGFEYTVGVLALVVALSAGVALIGGTTRGSVDRAGWFVATALVLAGVVGGASWRAATAGSTGANIGGDGLALVAPFVIAALLAVAAGIAARRADRSAWLSVCAAVLIAPTLLAAVFGLSYYDRRAGVASAAQFAQIHVGDERSAVHDRLGRPLQYELDWFFAPVRPPARCEYYAEDEDLPAPLNFQLCFLNGRVVSKEASRTYHPQ